MGLKSVLREVRRSLTFWIPIKKPPRWVWKAYEKWERRLPTHPYNMVKHFVGKNHIYKVVHGMEGQGQAPIIGWYVKKRIR